MKVLTGTLIVVLTLAASLPAAAAKQGYYRWTDHEGRLHFTQKPPHDRPYEFIPATAPWSDEKRSEQEQADQESGAASGAETEQAPEIAGQPAEPAPPKKMEVLPEKDPQACDQARQALSQLNNRAVRIRVTEEDGSQRLINEEEREQQRERAQEAITLHCE